jgi:hypothetical protein
MHVGLTNNNLKTCFEQNRRGHAGQQTKLIAECLSQGRQVKVLIATPEPFEWSGLPVNAAAGLEAGLIEMIRPAWDVTGAG